MVSQPLPPLAGMDPTNSKLSVVWPVALIIQLGAKILIDALKSFFLHQQIRSCISILHMLTTPNINQRAVTKAREGGRRCFAMGVKVR